MTVSYTNLRFIIIIIISCSVTNDYHASKTGSDQLFIVMLSGWSAVGQSITKSVHILSVIIHCENIVMYAIGHIRPHSVIVTNSAIPSFITRVLAS